MFGEYNVSLVSRRCMFAIRMYFLVNHNFGTLFEFVKIAYNDGMCTLSSILEIL